uniref:Ig-like domain-containing protein n=1 Tax=Leptobrachium leishanense TaxID=445787 RepID=A0A8C5QNM9_9ANUR
MWPGRGSGCWIVLIVILTPIWKDTACNGDNPDYKITVQREVTVPEGLCVTVPCNFTVDKTKKLENAVGYWQQTRDSAPCSENNPCYVKVVSSKSSETLSEKKSNFHLPGNPDTGDCTLTINDAKTQDTGWYYFRIEDGKDVVLKWTYTDSLYVTVTGSGYESWEKSYPLTVHESVSVPEGQCVTIPCSINNKSFSSTARGYWRKLSPDHSGCYPIVATNNKSVTPSDKMQTFRLTGNLSNGDCSLTINDAKKQDTGTYQFRIEDGGFRWSYRNNSLNVQVTEAETGGGDAESFPFYVTDVSVQEGLCVSIPCFFSTNRKLSEKIRGYWRKLSPDHSGCYLIVATNDKLVTPSDKIQTFRLTGDLSDGDCSLTINNANKQDAGTYQFRIEDGEFRWSYRNKHLNVKVTELKSPEIILPEKLVAGKNQTLTCRLPGLAKCPAYKTKISWEKYKTVNQGTYTNNTKESNFTFIPLKDDHQMPITCTVTLPSGKSTQKSVTPNVEYAPSISVSGESSGMPFNHNDSVNVTEGDNVTITFSIDSNPTANVTWRKGQEREYTALGQVLVVIPAISRQQSGTYTCLAQNEHGNNSITFHVNVSYPSRNPITGQESDISSTNIVLGLLCVVFGMMCAIFIVKLITKISGKPEPPRESAEDKPDSVYMNVHPASQVSHITTVDGRSTALDFTDSNGTQHYARIDFSKSLPHPRPKTTETLYAEVKKT